MNRKMSKKKGFTLLEILIATVIFAAVMTITTGVVAQSAGFQMKLREVRRVSEETRRINDLLITNIKNAGAEGIVTADQDKVETTKTFMKGLVLFDCFAESGNDYCEFRHFTSDDPLDVGLDPSSYSRVSDVDSKANTLVIFYKSNELTKYKIYQNYSMGGVNALFVLEGTGNSINLPDLLLSIRQTSNKISGKDDFSAKFGGYCPEKSSTLNLQPFVFLSLKSESGKNLADQNQKATASLRSAVTARSYNY